MPQFFNLQQFLEDRNRARTDLLWFCREVLRYRDVDDAVHGPICENLQQFKGGKDTVDAKGVLRPKEYLPEVPLWELTGPRNRLFLDPRGHLKTTIITISHSIQWIINYPDVRILISTATGELAERIVSEMLAHFRYNEFFRFLFPEFCPAAKKAGDFGNKDSFTVPNRERKWLKEPTVSVSTVGKTIAGGHYEVEKCSDMVDKENIKTPYQVRDVIEHFRYMQPLLETSTIAPFRGWIDVEGTRYDFADLYGSIVDRVKQENDDSWKLSIRRVWNEALEPLWPSRFPKQAILRLIAEMGEQVFSSQYLNEPVNDADGLCKESEIVWIPREVMEGLLPRLRLHTTIDLHGMEQKESNDSTVITTGGFDRDGRFYAVDIRKGHYTPFEVIDHLFHVKRQFPNLIDMKMEKDAHARVLLPFVQREQAKRGVWLPLVPIQRDNRTSKKQRIRGLQAWFHNHAIRFAADIKCRFDLVQEIIRFSPVSTWHDDILDTLADQLHNADGNAVGDVYPMEREPEIPGVPIWQRNRFLGFEKGTGREQWVFEPNIQQLENEYYHPKTGM